MRSTKEEAEKTRQAVIEAALRLSGRHGYAEAALRTISRESGASRGPSYWHFRNKTERYEAVMEISQAPLARLSHRSSTATNVGEIGGLERLVRDIPADAAHAGTACGGRS